MRVCRPPSLRRAGSGIAGCRTPIMGGGRARVVSEVVIGDNGIKKGDSSLAFCGTCLTEKFPEFKDIK